MIHDADQFFSEHPFFTTAEFAAAYTQLGHSALSVERVLAYHSRTSRIVRVRRGLYASMGTNLDPFLLANRVARDPTISYDGALAFHGLRGVEHGMSLASHERAPRVDFNDVIYRVVPDPIPPRSYVTYTDVHQRHGEYLRVATLARAFVDCLHRLDHGPGFIGTFLTFARNPEVTINFDEMLAYARKLNSGIAAARAGACLWAHPYWSGRTREYQFRLMDLATKHTMYAVSQQDAEGGRIARFRLVVPASFLTAMRDPKGFNELAHLDQGT